MITISIIVITALVSFSAFSNPDVFEKLCLYPYGMHQSKKEYFRLVSVGFVHADIGHLLFNMITLFFFGRSLEGTVFTELQFIILYMSAIVLSCLNEYSRQKDNPEYKACGASGAVSAVLFAQVLYNPWGVVYIKFIIPVYFILFAIGYLIYSHYMSKKEDERIAHNIHIGGALYGLAYTLILKPESLSYFLESILHPPFMN